MMTVFTLILCLVFVPTADGPVVSELIAAHNRERAERELPPLISEGRLAEAARIHAEDMAAHSLMSHDGSDGSTPADRVKRRKYPYVTTGENVAKGQTSVSDVMKAWMNSPHHRENILGDFSEIGVARVETKDGTPYWCVEFGRPYPKLDPDKAEAVLAERLNHARSDAGKDTIHIDPRLSLAARSIARDLAATASLKPDEKTPKKEFDRIAESGYRYKTVSQSNSSGTPSPEAVLRSLLDATDQKATLLGDFADGGFGYALAEDGRPYWCLILAKPLK